MKKNYEEQGKEIIGWKCTKCGVILPDSITPGTIEAEEATIEALKGCGISNHKCIPIWQAIPKKNPLTKKEAKNVTIS